jgi:hypothetical protein
VRVQALSTAILKPEALSLEEIEAQGRERELVVFGGGAVINVTDANPHVKFINFDYTQGIESQNLFVVLSVAVNGRDRGFFDAHCVEVLID